MGGGTEQPRELEEKYTRDKFVTLRALLAIQIVFGHTFPDNAYGIAILDKLLLPFNNTGFLCTSLFFFLSGYGVYESAKERDDYFDHFFIKKIVTILVPYWIINLIYVIIDSVLNRQFNIGKTVLSFVWPIYNRAAWYVFSVLMIYCIMYLVIDLLKLKGIKAYLAVFVLLSIYTGAFYLLKVGSHWFVSVYAVLFGIVFSDYKKRIVRRSYMLWEIALFVFLYVGMLWGDRYIPYVGKTGIKIILSVIGPLIVVTIMDKKRVETRWLNAIGIASYEIYLVQGLFVQYLNWPREPFYMNEFAALFNVLMAVMSGTIIAKPIHYLIQRLKKSIAS